MSSTEGVPPPHARMEIADCDAEPRHNILVPVVDFDEDEITFPTPCPACMAEDAWKRVIELENAAERRDHRRHPWAPWPITHWLASWAYRLGVISGYGTSYSAVHRGCVGYVHLRGGHPYVLGWPRWKWTCVLRGHHWPGEFIGFECCGKCVPWPCCGSTTYEHATGCDEA